MADEEMDENQCKSTLLLKIDYLKEELKQRDEDIKAIKADAAVQMERGRRLREEKEAEEEAAFAKLKASHDSIEEELDQTRKELQSKDNEIVEFRKEINELYEQLNVKAANQEALQKIQNELQETKAEMEVFVIANEALEEQIKEKEQQLEQCKEELTTFKAEYEQAREMFASKSRANQSLNLSSGSILEGSFDLSFGPNHMTKMPAQRYETVADMMVPVLEAEKKELTEQVASLTANLDQVTSDLSESKHQVTNLEAEKQELTEQVASLTANFDQVTSALNESKHQVISLEAQKQKLTEQVTSLETEKLELTEQVTNLEAQKQELVEQVASLTANFDRVTSALSESKNQVTSLEAQKQGLTEQVTSLTASFDQVTSDLNESKHQVTNLETEKRELTEQVTSLEAQKQELAKQVTVLTANFVQVTSALDKSKRQVTSLEAEKQELAEQVTALTANFDQVTSSLQSLQQSMTAMREHQDRKDAQTAIRVGQLERNLAAQQARAMKYKSMSETLTKDFDSLQEQLTEYRENLQEQSTANVPQLQQQLAEAVAAKEKFDRQIIKLKKDLKTEEESFTMERRTKERLLRENAALEKELSDVKRQLNELQQNVAAATIPSAGSSSMLGKEQRPAVKANMDPPADMPPLRPPAPPALRPSTAVIPPPHRLSNRFEMADEEGQFMDPTTIGSSQIFGSAHSNSSSSSTMPSAETTADRIAQLRYRNSLLQPHLRSTYPVELQELLNSMDENEIRSGSTQSLPAASAPSTSSSVAEFRAPAAPSLRRQTRSQTQLRTLASSSSSEENTRKASSRGRGSSSSSSSRQSSAVRRAASPASTDSTEQLPQKKAKKETSSSSSSMPSLTPSKLVKRVFSSKTWTPNKSSKKK